MVMIIAALMSISIASTLYLILHRTANRQMISQRLTSTTSKPFFTLPWKRASAIPKSTVRDLIIDLDQIGPKSKTMEYVLAGFRSQRDVLIYKNVKIALTVLPIVLLVGMAVTNTLTPRRFLACLLAANVLNILSSASLKYARQRRQKRILRYLPQFLDLLVVGVEAGLSFTAAMERIIKETDSREPLVAEFNLMQNEYLRGLSLAQACRRLDKRCGVPEFSFVLSSIIQSDEMGSSLGDTLRIQSKELRDKFRQRMREKAMRIPIKIIFPMLLFFVAIYILVLGPTTIGLKKMMTVGQESDTSALQQ